MIDMDKGAPALAKVNSPAKGGHIIIDAEKCKSCELCIHFCGQKNLALSDATNARGFHPAKLLEANNCTGCGNCALMCPEVCIRVYRRI
jgi:2-oxoglutarate ferredoxin oxidoreductase subunit delta